MRVIKAAGVGALAPARSAEVATLPGKATDAPAKAMTEYNSKRRRLKIRPSAVEEKRDDELAQAVLAGDRVGKLHFAASAAQQKQMSRSLVP